jgi:predicted nucleotidyltransferase
MGVLNPEIRNRALAAVTLLAQMGEVRAAYVFGSHVTGGADQWSDIDVAAFMDEVETWDLERRIDIFVKIQMEVGFDVEPHLFSSALLQHPEAGSFAADIIRHGVRIWEGEAL